MKKFLAAVLAAVVALGVFAGCNLTQTNDDNTVIAVVNGVNILKKKYNEMYDYYLNSYLNYGYEQADAVAALESYKQEFLDQLVQEELLRQRAEEEGYLDYTEEDIAAAKKIVDEDKQEYIDSLVESYTKAFEGQEVKGKNEGETDKEYFARIAEEKYHKDLKTNGYTYQEFVDEQLLATALEKYRDDHLVGVTVTEAEIIEKYDSMYNEQLEALSTDKKYVDAYNNATYSKLVYNRKGYSLVQQILVKFSDDDAKKLSELYTTLTEAKDDLVTLKELKEAETDADEKAKYEATIVETEGKIADAQKAYDEALAKAKTSIQSKTDEIYASVKDGDEANFIKVITEKSEDAGMTTEDAAKKGYLVGPEDGMVEEFSSAARALEEGKISEPVATYYGYHIIRCIKKIPEGKVAYDDAKADIEAELLQTEKDTQWQAMVDAWEEEADVKKYLKRI